MKLTRTKIERLVGRVMKKKENEEIEMELPFALMHLRTRLILGEQFESALEAVALSTPGSLGRELSMISMEIKRKGASVSQAFLHAIERVNSLEFRRACSHLAGLYEQGFSENSLGSLESLHRNLLSGQRVKLKDFSGKMVVYSLMFVAFSTVMPALFLAFILVGSMFLDLSFPPTTAFLVVMVVFPVMDLMVLLYIRERTPLFARA